LKSFLFLLVYYAKVCAAFDLSNSYWKDTESFPLTSVKTR